MATDLSRLGIGPGIYLVKEAHQPENEGELIQVFRHNVDLWWHYLGDCQCWKLSGDVYDNWATVTRVGSLTL